ncbi:unnamed protein product [Brassica rapa]|uniref:C2H2-type domain-containing protein n=2 Tax=Brassica TaxID=3705 RepID=A0A8D9H5L0_BRACM|nr:unnamed protein product [Brassica napus]CAG7893358.1 unnamed protein product [Brassica rapa]
MQTNPDHRVENQSEMAEEAANVDAKPPKAKDIRHYLCQYCGISRSKKYLITSHINSHHKMEVEMERDEEACEVDEEEVSGKHTCQECGAEFKKPAHLKQHMQSHSLERPFECYVDDCTSSYRRKDHLNRHLLTHKGKLFKCPVENCKSEFSVHGNISRHVKKFHSKDDGNKDDTGNSKKEDTGNGDSHHSESSTGQKKLVCKEKGCGKAFKYPSQLQKHQDSHVKLDSIEAFCSEPGCMKYFTNEECLKAHIRSYHQHINCEICGSKHLKKNIKRHLRTHEEDSSSPGEFKCEVEGCSSTFSKASNLRKHLKAVHEDIRPFVCGFSGCAKRFAYKHVRNNHEKSGSHIYTCGDFVEADEDFTSRPRGGVKRKHVTAEMLIRKRVMPPQFDSQEHETC